MRETHAVVALEGDARGDQVGGDGVGDRTSVRGIEHVGITVPDVRAATTFFEKALGAVVLYDLVADFEVVPSPRGLVQAPLDFDLSVTVGVPDRARLRALRLLRLGDGANVELFEYVGVGQQSAARPSDLGMQHLAFYVDDIEVAGRMVSEAGGELLEGPHLMPGLETGAGAKFHYARTPWGSYIELLTYPSPQHYTEVTSRRRWTPEPACPTT